jgi:hypothetical protein
MPAAHRLRRRARFAPAACALAALAIPSAALAAVHSEPADRAARSATPQLRPVAGNPADRMLSVPIDDERYDRSRRCTRGPRAGTLALQAWLERHARGAAWGIMRCERLSAGSSSLHADGRALDWHLDVSNPADRREAKRLIALMLAPDELGNEHALARRMGLQEIIWDCRSWWAGTEGMRPYSVCLNGAGELRRRIDVTTAHRDHVHFGLSFAGAARRTSFWAH